MKIEKDKFNSLSEKDQNLQLLKVSQYSILFILIFLVYSNLLNEATNRNLIKKAWLYSYKHQTLYHHTSQ